MISPNPLKPDAHPRPRPAEAIYGDSFADRVLALGTVPHKDRIAPIGRLRASLDSERNALGLSRPDGADPLDVIAHEGALRLIELRLRWLDRLEDQLFAERPQAVHRS